MKKTFTLFMLLTIAALHAMAVDITVTVPKDADFFLGIKPKIDNKITHFVAFEKVEAASVNTVGEIKTIKYTDLTDKQVYNYRTWTADGLTNAGYFTANADETKMPVLTFSAADYTAASPKVINHTPQSNQGYETGNILLNINEKNFKQMSVGDTYDVLALRSWQLTDNSTNNYFIEPDFHYTVLNLNGQEDNSVVTLDKTTTNTNSWVELKAVGEGTAIVLVTYDAINLNYYTSGSTTPTPYLGGSLWGAIWPENTGVFVVNVGNAAEGINPNMLLNQSINEATAKFKNAHPYIDAESDVFYYLDTEAGAQYTFTPSGVASVSIAHPQVGEHMISYNGFIEVTKNTDDSYTLLLKEGRNIVRLTDAEGKSVYQVITAKPCHYELINASGSKVFQPGDKVTVQYSGLHHAANKLAGIYNFSAYVQYNGLPNGSSLYGGAGQYTFGSSSAAQALTVTIPADWNTTEKPSYDMTDGVIKLTGFGDAVGNHRGIMKNSGRNPNLNAGAITAYFGQLPTINIPVSATRNIVTTIQCNAEDATFAIKDCNGNAKTANIDGTFTLTYGKYTYDASATGYMAKHDSFVIADDADDNVTITVDLAKAGNGAWDGKTLTEPSAIEGVYQISNGAEMAWFADAVTNGAQYTINGELTGDIDLANYDWTPIGGNSAAKSYKGSFNGNGHTVKNLYINSAATYQGLFGYVNGTTIKNLTVEGSVTANNNYVAGVIAYANASTLSNLTNKADVTGKQYVSGIVGNLAAKTSSLINAANHGTITGSGNFISGIAYTANAATTGATITNVLNTGDIVYTGTSATPYTGAIVGNTATTKYTLITNAFATKEYTNPTGTVVSAEQLASGEMAIALGEAWGQNLGKDATPVIGGMKVYAIEGGYTNNNPEYADLINFEDVDLDGASFYNSSDEAGLIATANDYSFLNYYTKASWGDSWCGFSISATTANDFNGYGTESEFNSCVGGAMESKQFAVGYYSEYNVLMEDAYPAIYATQAFKPEYVYINNSANSVISMENGDSYAKKFTSEDWFKLTIIGMTEDDEETGHVDFYLAKDGNIVKEWTKVDLTPLGAVDHVIFTMDSSDKSYGFINTPCYFCLDNMKSELTSDTPTAIAAVKEQKNKKSDINGKIIINGKVIIIRNGKRYDINGIEMK